MIRHITRRTCLHALFSSAAVSVFACRSEPSVPQAPPASPDLKATVSTPPTVNREPTAPQVEPTDHEQVAPAQDLKKVYLQPLGEGLSPQELTYVQDALKVFYTLNVVELPPVQLPPAAYYPPRSRYRAEKLLDFLKEQAPPDSHVIMGLTTVDISTTKGSYEDWGILGLATIDAGQCVVSRFRAQRGAKGEQHVHERLAKTVVHEVGHTLGLQHCPHHGCLMEDGKGTVTTTDHEYDLCDDCRKQVSHFVQERDAAKIPWAKP